MLNNKLESVSTVTGKNSESFWLLINIQDTKTLADLEKSEAEHKAEVVVIIGERKKEFTFEQFKELLGFE